MLFSLSCERCELTLDFGAAAGLVFLGSAGGGSLTGTVLSGTGHKNVPISLSSMNYRMDLDSVETDDICVVYVRNNQ